MCVLADLAARAGVGSERLIPPTVKASGEFPAGDDPHDRAPHSIDARFLGLE